MELELNGKDGKMLVEVDNMGRKISTLETEEELTCPACGNSFPINDFGSEEE